MKRACFLALFAAIIAIPAHAVLKEKSLESTLTILRGELTNTYVDLAQQSENLSDQQRIIALNLLNIYARSTQNSLMLYSQKQDYIFNLTYACHEATEMYTQFQKQSLPFRKYIESNASEIARYDSLIINLSTMPVMTLSPDGLTNRNVCLTLATSIRRTLAENSAQMADYITYYQRTEERLRSLNNYALQCYGEIQSSIFVNGGENYFTMLWEIGKYVKTMRNAVKEKYVAPTKKVRSQWDLRIILVLFATILVYALIAIGVNYLIIHHLLPKKLRTPAFIEKRTCIFMTTTVFTLAVILGVVRLVFAEQNFLIMASKLLVEYTWLLGVILISLLLRLDGAQIKSAFRIYAPLMVVGFLVISFRIVLIPNDLVNLIFPPILLLCTIWQAAVIRRHNKNIPRSDVYYTYASLALFILSVVCSWAGYTLFSVQALIWWIMQLTCILTITCISDWMKGWAKRKQFEKQGITKTWLYDFCNTVIMPVLAIASIVIAIYWAADVFNMSDTTWMIFTVKFIDTPGFSASIYGLCQVVALYFLFAYINRTVKALLAQHYNKSDRSTAASKNVLTKNIVQIVVWGLWLIISLSILHVGNSWLLVISGGLSTGIGFASKDILENIYYGISLMMGRVKIGDLIECDGYRGTVSSITYTSTMLNVADGSVIAFQNSQLFTKNYKNLTKNHGYELDKYDIGVAYGTDIDRARELLIKNISKLPFLRKNSQVIVNLVGFGESSVDLKVLCWVPVANYAVCGSKIMECIYKTLNDNNIEIPFPQLDVHKA
ncbi:MAG: mechanosensitive ion channel family protein [Prevotella sp.]|nr:mechanosensitive ion channel family protein [Prevotella sp.]